MVSQDCRSSHRMVRHPSRTAWRFADLTLSGTSMRTSALDTSSSCRTTGRVTRSVCLVGGTFPIQFPPSGVTHLTTCQDSPAAPIQLGRWQDFFSRYVVLQPKPAPRSGLNGCTQIGLLPRDNEEQIPFAYRLYKRTDDVGRQLAAGYKQTFCTPVTIDFVGVWYRLPVSFHVVCALTRLQGYRCERWVTLWPKLALYHKQRGDKGIQTRAVPR